MIKLYYAETINPRKACAAAKFLKAPVEFVLVDLGKGEQHTDRFRKLNPNAAVPVLVEKNKALWEANAIMCRLSQIMEADLWPADERQIDVLKWLSWDAVHFTRFGGTLYFENIVRPAIGLGAPNAEIVAEATTAFRRSARLLDDHLRHTRWVAGKSPTVADFALGAALPFAAPAQIPVTDFHNVHRWYADLCGLDGWSEPFPTLDRNKIN